MNVFDYFSTYFPKLFLTCSDYAFEQKTLISFCQTGFQSWLGVPLKLPMLKKLKGSGNLEAMELGPQSEVMRTGAVDFWGTEEKICILCLHKIEKCLDCNVKKHEVFFGVKKRASKAKFSALAGKV